MAGNEMERTAIAGINPPYAESPYVAVFGAIAPGWRWRGRDGDVPPSLMASRHLFYTLRMIWNHTMPAEAHVGSNIKRWSFGAKHPPEYMAAAVVQIGEELFRRQDLYPWMRAELEQMAAWYARIAKAAPTGIR